MPTERPYWVLKSAYFWEWKTQAILWHSTLTVEQGNFFGVWNVRVSFRCICYALPICAWFCSHICVLASLYIFGNFGVYAFKGGSHTIMALHRFMQLYFSVWWLTNHHCFILLLIYRIAYSSQNLNIPISLNVIVSFWTKWWVAWYLKQEIDMWFICKVSDPVVLNCNWTV